MKLQPTILIVEDDPAICALVRYNMESQGYRVFETGDGEQAVTLVSENRPDLIILDWMLPNVSGLEICRSLRRNKRSRDIPVIMLTARTEEADRIRGLDSGADDYVLKPFSPKELVARVKAVLRRSRPSVDADRLRYADIEMELETYRVRRGQRVVKLGPTEYRLLQHFLDNPRRVFSREQLLDSVWGSDVYVEPRTVDVHIRRLRKALNAPDEPDLIRTVRAAGYALEKEDAS